MSIDKFREKLIENLKVKKSSFHPVCKLDDKSNYKPYYKIERDGTIFERIFLDIPDVSIRENIICLHYLKNYVKVFLKQQVGINIISRDNPWDFKIELSTGEKFNVEITSIAEDADLFEKFKREERLILKSVHEEIPLHELIKLNSLFPNSEITDLISNYKVNGINKKDMVSNPYKDHNQNLFLSSRTYDLEPLEKLIREAIEGKESKKHLEKEETILLIDNRTLNYELSDLNLASESLSDFYENSSFREIWFYTGYCSDLDGNNAEYSLAPFKVTNNQLTILEKSKEENPPDKDGVIYL